MTEKLIPLEDAQSIVLSHVAPTNLVEIPVWQAAGFPLAEDAVAAALAAKKVQRFLLDNAQVTTVTDAPEKE